jgi:hypothetical protein
MIISVGAVPPVADQRRHHDARGDRRLAVLLADQQQEFADQPLRALGVIGPEDRADEIEHEVSQASPKVGCPGTSTMRSDLKTARRPPPRRE